MIFSKHANTACIVENHQDTYTTPPNADAATSTDAVGTGAATASAAGSACFRQPTACGVSPYMHASLYIHTYLLTYLHTYIRTYIHTHKYTHTHRYTDIHIPVCIGAWTYFCALADTCIGAYQNKRPLLHTIKQVLRTDGNFNC